MAFVVTLATIITDKFHGVSFRNVLRVLLHKALHTVPKSGYGLPILIQTDDKTVLLVVVLHVAERIE